MTEIETLKSELLAAVAAATDLAALEAVRLDALGKKGRISVQLKTLGGLEPELRKQTGQALNLVKDEVAEAISVRQAELEADALSEQLANERVDISLPVQEPLAGGIHPLSRTMEEIAAIFADMGFSIAEGPDIETDFYNFTALNIPPEHPARQEIPFICARMRQVHALFCVPIPRRCKFVPCKRQHRLFASLFRVAPIAQIMMPPIRRCFINVKGW